VRRVIVMSVVALTAAPSFAAEPEAKEFKSDGKALPYRLLVPENIKSGQKYPLVVILHGAGERGVDNKKQLVWFWNDKKPSVMARPEVAAEKALVIVPQCPEGERFVEVPWEKGSYKSPEISTPLELPLALVDSFIKEQPIDADRAYVVGTSMGGYGALDAVQCRPELFAACVPICGAGDPSKAKDSAHVPVWAFHGADDTAVPVSGSRELYSTRLVVIRARRSGSGGSAARQQTRSPNRRKRLWGNLFGGPTAGRSGAGFLFPAPGNHFPVPMTLSWFPITRSWFPITRSPVPMTPSWVPITHWSVPMTASSVPMTRSWAPMTPLWFPMTLFSVPITPSSVSITPSSVPGRVCADPAKERSGPRIGSPEPGTSTGSSQTPQSRPVARWCGSQRAESAACEPPSRPLRSLCSRDRFSSSLCDRLMLRQPSACHHSPREEGCSSTAIDASYKFEAPTWNNPAHRGSGASNLYEASAVP
jgi:predicted esterase